MGCTNCKKKKQEIEKLKTPSNSTIKFDRVIGWIIIGWFFLGIYGLWTLIGKLFN
jgi:uncharacterized membrane protein YraQ (UPF0718 family)